MNTKRFNYSTQFALLMGFMGLGMILSAIFLPLLGSQVLNIPSSEVMHAINLPANARVSQLLNTLAAAFSFLMPSFLLARLVSKTPFFEMGFQRAIHFRQIFLVILISLACLILSGSIAHLNEQIPLPKTWLEKAKMLEEVYTKAMLAMAKMNHFTDYLLGLLVIAFFPALFEELLFRGGFQQILVGWFKNKWVGIILASILFSLIHFSFFGFLPRFFLGIVLGWLFYESKNIGLSILMHFINNALVVTQLYWLSQQGESLEKAMDQKFSIWLGLIALGFLVYLWKLFTRETHRYQINNSTDV